MSDATSFLRGAEKCGTIHPVSGQETSAADSLPAGRVAAVRERATRVATGPAPVLPMPASIPAIRYADRRTTALLAKLRLDARRFDVIFTALATAFDAGAAPTASEGPSDPRAPLDGPAAASPSERV